MRYSAWGPFGLFLPPNVANFEHGLNINILLPPLYRVTIGIDVLMVWTQRCQKSVASAEWSYNLLQSKRPSPL